MSCLAKLLTYYSEQKFFRQNVIKTSDKSGYTCHQFALKSYALI